jgi:hypothetical protein
MIQSRKKNCELKEKACRTCHNNGNKKGCHLDIKTLGFTKDKKQTNTHMLDYK